MLSFGRDFVTLNTFVFILQVQMTRKIRGSFLISTHHYIFDVFCC